jgi:hypothetical protein
METSQTIAKISAALVKAQSEMGNAVKGSANPFFKSKYADLNAIREVSIPVLNKHGISVLQPTCVIDGRNYVKTLLLHESGEYLSGVTEIVSSKPNDAQAHGSGVTYARRYGLQSLLNIGADDDDGNAASNPKAKEQPITERAKLHIQNSRTLEDLAKVKDYLTTAELKSLYAKKLEELSHV